LPIPWNDDPPGSEAQIQANIAKLLARIHIDASPRVEPSMAMAQLWHRDIYEGIPLPVPYYAGEFRDSDASLPELFGYEVRIGPHFAVASDLVPAELGAFERGIQRAIRILDGLISSSPTDVSQLQDVIAASALAHGEWVRIHPFANGNGRTARMWVRWITARYNLPAYLSVKPRPPAHDYDIASAASMTGDHAPMEAFLMAALIKAVSTP